MPSWCYTPPNGTSLSSIAFPIRPYISGAWTSSPEKSTSLPLATIMMADFLGSLLLTCLALSKISLPSERCVA